MAFCGAHPAEGPASPTDPARSRVYKTLHGGRFRDMLNTSGEVTVKDHDEELGLRE